MISWRNMSEIIFIDVFICDADCGAGIITLAEGENATITSPNFDNGGPYPTGKKCVWLVKVGGTFVGLSYHVYICEKLSFTKLRIKFQKLLR
jgi:hypothetical protein